MHLFQQWRFFHHNPFLSSSITTRTARVFLQMHLYVTSWPFDHHTTTAKQEMTITAPRTHFVGIWKLRYANSAPAHLFCSHGPTHFSLRHQETSWPSIDTASVTLTRAPSTPRNVAFPFAVVLRSRYVHVNQGCYFVYEGQGRQVEAWLPYDIRNTHRIIKLKRPLFQ